MAEKIVAVAALLAIMLGPETICNVLHIGEYPPEQSAPAVVIKSVETEMPITTTFRPAEEETMINPSPLPDAEWATLVDVCEERSIDISLALGLIWVESRFDPEAVSPEGSYGYCQINPRWHPADLSPVENIRYGIEYLAECISRYDNLEAGLTAYNAGCDTGSRQYANAVLEAAEKGPWEKVTNGNH